MYSKVCMQMCILCSVVTILTEGMFIEYQLGVRSSVGCRGDHGLGVGGTGPAAACPPSEPVSELQAGTPATTANDRSDWGWETARRSHPCPELQERGVGSAQRASWRRPHLSRDEKSQWELATYKGQEGTGQAQGSGPAHWG